MRTSEDAPELMDVISISRDILKTLYLYIMVVVLCTRGFCCTCVHPRMMHPSSVPLPQLLLPRIGFNFEERGYHSCTEPNKHVRQMFWLKLLKICRFRNEVTHRSHLNAHWYFYKSGLFVSPSPFFSPWFSEVLDESWVAQPYGMAIWTEERYLSPAPTLEPRAPG